MSEAMHRQLDVVDRVNCKIGLLVYKCLHGLVPGLVQDQYNLISNKLQQNGFQLKGILTIMKCQQDQKDPLYLSRNSCFQLLNFQRIFKKKEKTRTNENCISLYFIYDTYLNNKENKERPISIDKPPPASHLTLDSSKNIRIG